MAPIAQPIHHEQDVFDVKTTGITNSTKRHHILQLTHHSSYSTSSTLHITPPLHTSRTPGIYCLSNAHSIRSRKEDVAACRPNQQPICSEPTPPIQAT